MKRGRIALAEAAVLVLFGAALHSVANRLGGDDGPDGFAAPVLPDSVPHAELVLEYYGSSACKACLEPEFVEAMTGLLELAEHTAGQRGATFY